MHLGATLRLLRVDAGLSLRDLARRIGVSSAYLSRVENGVDAPPTQERLTAIARELDVPPGLLMDVANRVSPYVAGYLEDVPAAGTLMLDIARRKLTGAQLARVRAFLDAEFPLREVRGNEPVPPLGPLLSAERVVLQLSCGDYEDALDVAAGRLAAALPGVDGAALAEGLRQREGTAPSQVGSGVAVPHAFVPGAAPVAALVTLARPLKVDAPDGQPLRLVVALVDGHVGRARLMRLAHVARLAGRGLADRLHGLEEPQRVLETLEELETLR
ncbi:helix-turn-helix domain-containing protein [Corallococcus exiguus]|uniref:Helix-turn-helix domain-containing protein n=1 Tax=Corallococcus exiguus TaxID=83462 RepID=A0A7X4YHV8_9BACT|nr:MULTISPECIES: helix-turn-helix domain-containing protein [Corallococcus]NBC45711.1 helix-turn-helix domain-containing protein [Corallococcus exiguus]NNC15616.1 helix-turn-helix domain-containing protein [Corallococcus exiguus]NRD53358.1 helix-turn-helix domain-containing protein [Corallococcus exiguus]NRD63203.1 helix-turn-helix domain-containing protein [Corallococcus exiguus]RKH20893.1 helix-turn-helix domain-containing protein [Corallococcus sp. CA041A]